MSLKDIKTLSQLSKETGTNVKTLYKKFKEMVERRELIENEDYKKFEGKTQPTILSKEGAEKLIDKNYIDVPCMKENENFIHNKYGYCYYEIKQNNVALIYNLYVEQYCRRKGHAKHLIQLVINEINNIIGCNKEIQVKAEPQENSISIEKLIYFYEEMGLKVIREN